MRDKKRYQEEGVFDGEPVTCLYDITGYLITRKRHSDIVDKACFRGENGQAMKMERVYESWGWTEYTYNEDGDLMSEDRCSLEQSNRHQIKYTYNKRGMMTSKKEFDGEGRIIREIVRTQELAQAALTRRRKVKEGIPGIGMLEVHGDHRVEIYNKYGDLCSKVLFGRDGSVIGRTVYKYNDDKKLVQKKVWDKDRHLLWISYDYDREGRLKTKRVFDGEKICTKVEFSYSDKGVLLCRAAEITQTQTRGGILDDTLHMFAYRDYNYAGNRLGISHQKEQLDRRGKRVSFEHKFNWKQNSRQGD